MVTKVFTAVDEGGNEVQYVTMTQEEAEAAAVEEEEQVMLCYMILFTIEKSYCILIYFCNLRVVLAMFIYCVFSGKLQRDSAYSSICNKVLCGW